MKTNNKIPPKMAPFVAEDMVDLFCHRGDTEALRDTSAGKISRRDALNLVLFGMARRLRTVERALEVRDGWAARVLRRGPGAARLEVVREEEAA